jgi:ribonuclease BN (tRNA processing enzyme)
MEVTTVGSGTGVPSLKRASPAILVSIEGEYLLFDSGPGIIRKLLELNLTYHDINRIFYTHLHPDHINDLAAFLFATKNTLSPRRKELEIIGPPGLKVFYQKLLELYGDTIYVQSYQIMLNEVLNETINYNNYRLITTALSHTSSSIGYRIEDVEGKAVVYSGDTDYCREIVNLASKANLLILESSLPDNMKVKGHLTPSVAGRIASEANCQKLILTHLYPICNSYDIEGECRRVFSGDITVAYDLMKVRVGES